MTETHKVIVTGSGAIAVRDYVHGINTYGFECREDAEKACDIAAAKYAKAVAAKTKPAPKPEPAPEPAPTAKKKKKPAAKKKKPKR